MTRNRKGFTLLELLIGIVIVCIIVLIALPLSAIRAKRLAETGVRMQLEHIREAEEVYRAKHGCYTSDVTKLANWKRNTKKYYFRIRDAGSTRFVAEANGDLNNDKLVDDTWTINENGVLTNEK